MKAALALCAALIGAGVAAPAYADLSPAENDGMVRAVYRHFCTLALELTHLPRKLNTKNWRNPYLIVRADGVVLYDTADSAEIILKPNEVIGALAQLPRSNWPYGRVVAATETAAASDKDGVAIRRNKGLVGGLLEEANVAIRWVPGT